MKAEDELSDLYRQYSVLVRTRAAELLFGDKAAAEDVAHEVFIKFMRYRAKHAIDGSPAPLLYCITHRVCVDRMRKSYRHAELVKNAPVHGDIKPSVEDQIALAQALQSMREDEARIGAAFFLDDFEVHVIAAAMRLSDRTVRRRLHSFRMQMRRFLNGGTT